MEDRDVATLDIPNAFMQAKMDSTVYMKLVGKVVDLLVDINGEKFATYTTTRRGKTIRYVRLKKAYYGTCTIILRTTSRRTGQHGIYSQHL
jgi:hypothetical protein